MGNMNTVEKISVIVPTLNESGNIVALVKEIHSQLSDYPHEIIVVDDNSPDGTYKIVIEEVKEDGELVAKYLNPDPINIGRSGWRNQDDKLEIYIELRDENYPGSIYQLTYNENTKTIFGTYYLALTRQTYEVSFNKIK